MYLLFDSITNTCVVILINILNTKMNLAINILLNLNIRSSLFNSKLIYFEIHAGDIESIYRHKHIESICDFEILFIWPFRSTGKHHLTYELLFSNYIFISRCFCANQKVITHDLIDLSKFGKNTHTVHSKKETGLNGS